MALGSRTVLGCQPFTDSWSWPEDNAWNTVQWSVCGTGVEQSPIDLRTCNQIEPSANPIVPNQWGTASEMVYSHGIKINMPASNGQNWKTSMRGLMYTVVQCHLHWGSEHFIDGTQEALCMHCVHAKDVVPPGGRMYGVLGFIWELGDADPFLDPWITAAPGHGEADATADVDMTKAYEGMDLANYWQYDGGLTTPPCSEAVDWHVLMQKRSVSQSQLDTVMDKTHVDGGNFRRPQDLNGRQVLGCVGGQGSDLEQESDGASHRGWTAVLSILVFLSFC